jgi:fructose-bisphosphate aldolase class I
MIVTHFYSSVDHGVYMASWTLKPNIINPGKNCPISYTVEEMAEANTFVFEKISPVVTLKGFNYLSCDLAMAAASCLSAINKANNNTKGPWNSVCIVVCLSLNCFQIFVK